MENRVVTARKGRGFVTVFIHISFPEAYRGFKGTPQHGFKERGAEGDVLRLFSFTILEPSPSDLDGYACQEKGCGGKLCERSGSEGC